MRLILRQDGAPTKEYQIDKELVLIGRQEDCDVVLQSRTASRKHAQILRGPNGSSWLLEDLGSANKTYLNDRIITGKTTVKTGDEIRITNIVLEVDLQESSAKASDVSSEETMDGEQFNLEASLSTPKSETLIRKPDAQHAPAMRLAAKRLTEFSQATQKLCDCDSLDSMLVTLMDLLVHQFTAFHVWCALREQGAGPMTYHAGKRRDGQKVELKDLQLQDMISQAIERGQSIVLPRVSAKLESKDRIRSALIAPIIRNKGCFGIMYIDNAMVHEHYSLSDLDYLMFISIHIAAILKRFLNE
ncbi:MAG: FHA domain-containing protein [Candidatus Cloacimonetes bacterium]|nr:FHA domain-containing protein [Candidatus Cloacimonadota bacterium]